MMYRILQKRFAPLVFIILFAAACSPQPEGGLQFKLTLDETVQTEPYSGRVYVMINPDTTAKPRLSVGWVNPPPFFSKDVKNIEAGAVIVIDSAARHYPIAFSEIKPGTYSVQAVARRSKRYPNPGRSPGDLYSKPVIVELHPDSNQTIPLHLTEVVPEQEFEETERIKLVNFESALLSEFHGRPFTFNAGVALPVGWSENSTRTYPVVYYITGFGGSHYGISRMLERLGSLVDEAIVVIPDARNYWGHSVFANSENTGPWGSAFIEELIPLIDDKFRGAGAGHRYVTGVSSGGWSSLWLQITYPEQFNGVWSIVPDPVDFRDFQQINLYKPGANMYVDENGDPRPLARAGGNVIIWYKDFVMMEKVWGPGGQIRSFEAVFSPRGENGKPLNLFDRETGIVNPEVAEAWKEYDINLILKNNWAELGPKLKGKLHIYAGSEDTFYLEGAVELLKPTLKELGSDAEVEIVEGMTHAVPEGLWQDMFETIYAQQMEAVSTN